MVTGMKRMQKCQYLPPHAAGKICPSLQASLPSGSQLGGKEAYLRLQT